MNTDPYHSEVPRQLVYGRTAGIYDNVVANSTVSGPDKCASLPAVSSFLSTTIVSAHITFVKRIAETKKKKKVTQRKENIANSKRREGKL